MRKCSLGVVLVICFLQLAICKELPLVLKRCKIDEELNGCLTGAIQDALPYLKDGFPELNFPPLDPFPTYFDIVTGNLHQTYTNTSCVGLTTSKITGVEASLDSDSLKLTINFNIPKLQVYGDHVSKGQIGGMPVNGKGKYSWNFVDTNTTITFYGKKQEKLNETFMIVDDVNFKYTSSKVVLNLDELVSDNKPLIAELNEHLEKNWHVVQEEIQPAYFRAMVDIYKKLANSFFENVPYNKIFKTD